MDVSIIIVNYNTKELLYNCIQSIYKFSCQIKFEIIVVDNNSHDGSSEMISSNFPDILLIKLSENIGFGRANNKGVKIATGKYFLFLNSDTLLGNDSIKIFFDYMELNNYNNKIGAIGAFLLDKDGNIIHSFGQFPRLSSDIILIIKKYLISLLGESFYDKIKNTFTKCLTSKINQYSSSVEHSVSVDYITGADLFVPAEIFKNLGCFDQRYFMYYEETDLQFQMQRSDLKRLLIQGPEIYHFEGSSFEINKKKSNSRRICLDTSHILYYKKNFNTFIYYLFLLSFFCIQLITIFDISYTLKEKIDYFKVILKNF